MKISSFVSLFKFCLKGTSYAILFLSDFTWCINIQGPSLRLQGHHFRAGFLWLSHSPLYKCTTPSLSSNVSQDILLVLGLSYYRLCVLNLRVYVCFWMMVFLGYRPMGGGISDPKLSLSWKFFFFFWQWRLSFTVAVDNVPSNWQRRGFPFSRFSPAFIVYRRVRMAIAD